MEINFKYEIGQEVWIWSYKAKSVKVRSRSFIETEWAHSIDKKYKYDFNEGPSRGERAVFGSKEELLEAYAEEEEARIQCKARYDRDIKEQRERKPPFAPGLLWRLELENED